VIPRAHDAADRRGDWQVAEPTEVARLLTILPRRAQLGLVRAAAIGDRDPKRQHLARGPEVPVVGAITDVVDPDGGEDGPVDEGV
jgi:hypothetical protein